MVTAFFLEIRFTTYPRSRDALGGGGILVGMTCSASPCSTENGMERSSRTGYAVQAMQKIPRWLWYLILVIAFIGILTGIVYRSFRHGIPPYFTR
jgi:hypothetical protein